MHCGFALRLVRLEKQESEMRPNHAFESGRAEERRVLNRHLPRRAAQRER
jgi:hypothetical protein